MLPPAPPTRECRPSWIQSIPAAGMLVAEQQFRRITGYRDLAKLVIAVERHALATAPKNLDRQEADPATV